MALLKMCAVCCMCLSVWGFVQLLIMGLMFRSESVTFIEESEASDAENAEEFITKTKEGYKKVSFNCCIAGTLYGVSFAISMAIFLKSKRSVKIPDDAEERDDAVCGANLDAHNLDQTLQDKLDAAQEREKVKEKARAAKRQENWENEEKISRQRAERLQEKADRQRRREEASLKTQKAAQEKKAKK